jgi:hypothetical protein
MEYISDMHVTTIQATGIWLCSSDQIPWWTIYSRFQAQVSISIILLFFSCFWCSQLELSHVYCFTFFYVFARLCSLGEMYLLLFSFHWPIVRSVRNTIYNKKNIYTYIFILVHHPEPVLIEKVSYCALYIGRSFSTLIILLQVCLLCSSS